MKIYENTRFQEYTKHKNHRNAIFSEKNRLRQCITHTQGIKIPGTSLFPTKKAPAAVHHTHTGHKNTRNVMFSKKQRHISIYVYIYRERERDIDI